MKEKEKILFFIHSDISDIYDGRNIRIFNIAKILSKKYTLDLICLENINKEKYSLFNDIFIFNSRYLIIRGVFYSVFTARTNIERYMNTEAINFINKNKKKYKFVFCNYIHTAQNLVKINIKKYVDLVDSISLHYKESINIAFFRKQIYKIDYKKVLKQEIDIIKNFNHSFITSEKESLFLIEHDKLLSNKITVIENGIQHNISEPITLTNNKKEIVLGFLGKLDYYANENAVEFIAKEIMPKLKLIYNEIKCFIIGASPSPKVLKYNNYNNIKIIGFVENLEDAFKKIDIMILPMQIASGIQNKLINSMSFGMPVVIFERAIINNVFQNNKNLKIAKDKDTEEFINCIIELINDFELRKKIGENAFHDIKSFFNWERIAEKLLLNIENDLRNEKNLT